MKTYRKIYLLFVFTLIMVLSGNSYGMKSNHLPDILKNQKEKISQNDAKTTKIVHVTSTYVPEQLKPDEENKGSEKSDSQVEKEQEQNTETQVARSVKIQAKIESNKDDARTKQELFISKNVDDEDQHVSDTTAKEHDNRQCILFVGGGNLSFELNWVEKHPGFNRSNIMVSIFENEFVDEFTEENAKKLLNLGVTVLCGVDATKLHQKQEKILVVSYDEKLNKFNYLEVGKFFSDGKIMAVFFSHPCRDDGVTGGAGTGRTLIVSFMFSAGAAKIPTILIPRGKAGPRWEEGGKRYKEHTSKVSLGDFQQAVWLLSKRIYQFHATKGRESKYPIRLPQGYKLIKKHNFRNPRNILISQKEPYPNWRHTKNDHKSALGYLEIVGSTCYVFQKIDDQDHKYNSDYDTDTDSDFEFYYQAVPLHNERESMQIKQIKDITAAKDEFLKTIVERYIAGMRNDDPDKGDVLWGGQPELSAMAKLYKLRITIKRQNGELDAPIGPEDGTPITLAYNGINHYDWYDSNEQLQTISRDGNCMFNAVQQAANAKGVATVPKSVAAMRAAAMDDISNDGNAKNSIHEQFAATINAENDELFGDTISAIPLGELRDEAESLYKQSATKHIVSLVESVESLGLLSQLKLESSK